MTFYVMPISSCYIILTKHALLKETSLGKKQKQEIFNFQYPRFLILVPYTVWGLLYRKLGDVSDMLTYSV